MAKIRHAPGYDASSFSDISNCWDTPHHD